MLDSLPRADQHPCNLVAIPGTSPAICSKPTKTIQVREFMLNIKMDFWGLPWGLVVKTPCSQCRGSCSNPRSHMLQLKPGTVKQTNK